MENASVAITSKRIISPLSSYSHLPKIPQCVPWPTDYLPSLHWYCVWLDVVYLSGLPQALWVHVCDKISSFFVINFISFGITSSCNYDELRTDGTSIMGQWRKEELYQKQSDSFKFEPTESKELITVDLYVLWYCIQWKLMLKLSVYLFFQIVKFRMKSLVKKGICEKVRWNIKYDYKWS